MENRGPRKRKPAQFSRLAERLNGAHWFDLDDCSTRASIMLVKHFPIAPPKSAVTSDPPELDFPFRRPRCSGLEGSRVLRPRALAAAYLRNSN